MKPDDRAVVEVAHLGTDFGEAVGNDQRQQAGRAPSAKLADNRKAICTKSLDANRDELGSARPVTEHPGGAGNWGMGGAVHGTEERSDKGPTEQEKVH